MTVPDLGRTVADLPRAELERKIVLGAAWGDRRLLLNLVQCSNWRAFSVPRYSRLADTLTAAGCCGAPLSRRNLVALHGRRRGSDAAAEVQRLLDEWGEEPIDATSADPTYEDALIAEFCKRTGLPPPEPLESPNWPRRRWPGAA